MKLSKYVALAKRESFCRVIHVEESGVWLGLRGAFYRATELPDIHGGDQAKAVLDIPDKAFGKMFFEEAKAESESNIYGVDMTPGAPNEQPATELDMQVEFRGIGATALVCEDGELVFYNSALTAPISDVMKESDYIQTVIRTAANGTKVIVIKDGFEPLAAIMPIKMLGKQFMQALYELENLCAGQYEKESGGNQEEGTPDADAL